MLTNGALIADRYRLHRLIATGGMGQVWEALDTRLDRRVAVKVLKAEFSADPTFRHRFRTEAKTTAQLNHPGIAGIYDYGETMDPAGGETAYLVMELVSGEPLNAVLNRMTRLSVVQGLDMLEQTARALQVAHAAGVVHRDVKPGNILVTPTGQVKITDFGIAKAVDASPVTKTGMVMGTAQYIAPEQATGEDATAASDVYSLAVVGYEAFAGTRPFTGDGALTVAMKHVRETPPPLPADLPPNVRELIEITLAKEPTQRYTNGGEFADAVAAVRAGRRPPPPNGLATTAMTSGAGRIMPPPGPTMVIPTPLADQATVRYPSNPARPQQPPPTSATAIMAGPATPPPGLPPTGAHTANSGGSRFTNGQKALAGLGVGALILGSAAAFALLGGDPPEPPVPTKTSAVVVPPPVPSTSDTTTEAPTTTQYVPPPPTVAPTIEPEPTTTEPEPTTTTPPPTTTSQKPTVTATTKPEQPTTTAQKPTKTTPGLPGIPGVEIPSTWTPGQLPGVRGNTTSNASAAIPQQGLP
ncbi:protein kinase [Nocardia uniformis]|uniref:non-specific serine/threonine protein kinase n=1 Tax=Nocardia uniformis TaxID=53432 RepID=A0A849CC60_9NOCA|nr:serine/threonine-protein kinase [Nocardia uniformis]NNH73970.1 protein kinase [Nocardia uniformis]